MKKKKRKTKTWINGGVLYDHLLILRQLFFYIQMSFLVSRIHVKHLTHSLCINTNTALTYKQTYGRICLYVLVQVTPYAEAYFFFFCTKSKKKISLLQLLRT